MQCLRAFVACRITEPLRELTLREKVTVLSVGIVGGVFPIPVLTSAATLLMCRILQFNVAQTILATTVNLLVAPLELLLIVPCARLAAKITGCDAAQFTTDAFQRSIKLGLFDALHSCTLLFLHSCLAWLALALPFLYTTRRLHRHSCGVKTV